MTQNSFSPLPDSIAHSPVATIASTVYSAGIAIRNFWYDAITAASKKVDLPVISIGGIRAGGSGKTPSTILVASLIEQAGYTAAILSRGYRRVSSELKFVAPSELVDWKEIGDEPAMIRNAIPGSWMGIHADRVAAARSLQNKVPDKTVFLLDDGFQHRRLYRNLDIVCLHENAFDDHLIPKGYLREPLCSLNRANVVFLIGEPDKTLRLRTILEKKFPNLELFELLYKPQGYVHAGTKVLLEKPPCETFVGLCGIARPERFFSMLKEEGLTIHKEFIFPDHYRYRKDDISSIQKLYSSGILTTEKDSIRLLDKEIAPEGNFWYLKMCLQFSSENSLNRFNKLLKMIF
jgi:tetraacyldisaccharide 4'-kinase